jgi:hypothetical protein
VAECGDSDAAADPGTLYLIGLLNKDRYQSTGDDNADLFRVELGADGQVEIVRESRLHLYCGYRGTNHCNFAAAAGTYVDPDGRLFLYATEHDNYGPRNPLDDNRSIKFMEFRPVPHGPCERIEDAWVELYDDDNYQDRSLMIGWVDRNLEDYCDYREVDDFDGRASSVRWCLPRGLSYRLYSGLGLKEGTCGGGMALELHGDGTLHAVADLTPWGFNDAAICSFDTEDMPVGVVVHPVSGGTLMYQLWRRRGGRYR